MACLGLIQDDYEITRARQKPANAGAVARVIINDLQYKNVVAIGADERGFYVGPNYCPCSSCCITGNLVPWKDVRISAGSAWLFDTSHLLVLRDRTSIEVRSQIFNARVAPWVPGANGHHQTTPPTTQKFKVTVPAGVTGGQAVQVTTPEGLLVQVVVPTGLGPGAAFEVETPPGTQSMARYT